MRTKSVLLASILILGIASPLSAQSYKSVYVRTDADLSKIDSAVNMLVVRHTVELTDEKLRSVLVAKDLSSLTIVNCKLSEVGYRSLGKLQKLTSITLSGISGRTAGLGALHTLPLLYSLDISAGQGADTSFLSEFAGHPKLSSLKLTQMEFGTKGFVEALVAIPMLKNLTLSYGSLGTGDVDWSRLSKAKRLAYVSLSGTKGLTAKAMAGFAAAPLLTTINVSKGDFDDDSLGALGSAKMLGKLYLWEVPITGTGLAKLKSCPLLTKLSIYQCAKLSDVGLAGLAGCESISDLTLNNCPSLTDTGVVRLAKMKKLTRLSLSDLPRVTMRSAGWVRYALPKLRLILDNLIPRRYPRKIASRPPIEVNKIARIYNDAELSGLDKETDAVHLMYPVSVAQLKQIVASNKLATLELFGATNEHLQVIKNETSLRGLWIYKSPDVTDAGIEHLSRLRKLVILQLAVSPSISDSSAKVIARFKALEQLTLGSWENKKVGDETALTDTGLAEICSLRKLKTLVLTLSGRVSAKGFEAIKNLKKLEGIWLRSAGNFSDDTVSILVKCKKLREVALELCGGITPKGLNKMAKIKKLAAIFLYECSGLLQDEVWVFWDSHPEIVIGRP